MQVLPLPPPLQLLLLPPPLLLLVDPQPRPLGRGPTAACSNRVRVRVSVRVSVRGWVGPRRD